MTQSTLTRTAPTYYVRIDTYWQGSQDRFVGPFQSREDAQAEIDRAWNAGFHSGFPANVGIAGMASPSNLKSAIRVFPTILTKTQATRMGMRVDDRRDNVIGTTIPRDTTELLAIETGYAEADYHDLDLEPY